MPECKYCMNGHYDMNADEHFQLFPVAAKNFTGNLNRPHIYREHGTNRYFLSIEGLYPMRISFCTVCGRWFTGASNEM